MKEILTSWREMILLGTAIGLTGAAAVLLLRRRPEDPDETERRRRLHLNRIGRIVEGQVLELQEEISPEAGTPKNRHGRNNPTFPGFKNSGNGNTHKLLFYTYSISGVTYETAQDITGLEERACLSRVIAGQPASVKYDPANPSNSILLADDWSGLH